MTDAVPLGPLGRVCHNVVLILMALVLLPLRVLLLLLCAVLGAAFANLAGDRTEQRGAPKWLAAINCVLGRLAMCALGV